MANPSESQSSEAPEDITQREYAPPLKYPQIYLETSFDSLLKNSYASHSSSSTLTMTRTNHPSGPPALSESWASMSDAELSQNDELLSEQTDVESLVDVGHEDDILSTQEEEESVDNEQDSAEQDSPKIPVPQTHTDTPPPGQQSLMESSLLPNHITLDEPRTSGQSDNVFVRHTLKVFSPEEAKAAFPQLDTSELVGTIDLTLNRLSLKENGRESLRLLLLGNDYLPSLRDSIVTKVADALVTSGSAFSDSQISSPSRYHVVPDCFGPGSMPSAAELIPVGCQLEVDRYNDIRKADGAWVLTEATTGKTLVYKGGPRQLSHDLAIIVTSNDDSSGGRDTLRRFAALTKKYSIPCIVITMDDAWDLSTSSLPSGVVGLRRAIASRPVWDGSVLRCLPLDLDTFLNLNAVQLSRHLSWLIEHGQADALRPGSEHRHTKHGSLLDALQAAEVHLRRVLSRISTIFIVTIVAFLAMHSISTFWRQQQDIALRTTNKTSDFLVGSSTVDATTTSTKSSSIVVATTASPFPVPLTLDATKSTSGRFEVEVIGSSHLVVRTPHKAKGKSPLKIVISREGRLIPAEIKLLFPCVYSVHVPTEQLYGDISIRLEMPNPRLVDTIKLDLGSQSMDSWLKQIVEDAEHNVQSRFANFQAALDRLRQPEVLQKFADQAQVVVAGVSERLGFEERVQKPLRILETHRVAFNARVDAMGEELYIRLMQWRKHHPFSRRDLSNATKLVQDRFSSLQLKLPSFEAARHGFGIGQRFRNTSLGLRKGSGSEKLAVAQGRAQHLVNEWRPKKDKRSRPRGH